MGLAYDLRTLLYPFLGDSQTLFQSAQILNPDAKVVQRWQDITIDEDFEIIVRNMMYSNGKYYIIGSYKAQFDNLFGAGIPGYAWDGFLMITRAYNLVNFAEAGPMFEPPELQVIVVPMRMPMEVNPGPVGSAAAIAADDTPGLYGIDVNKTLQNERMGPTYLSQPQVQDVVVCGCSRFNPTVEGGYTDLDYIANIYQLRTASIDIGDTAISLIDWTKSFQFTWRANVAGHIDNTPAAERPSLVFDIDEWLGDNRWRGSVADGGDAEAAGRSLFGGLDGPSYVPRKLFDIATMAQTPPYLGTGGADPTSPGGVMLVGECAQGTLGGAVTYTAPLLIYGAINTSLSVAPSPQIDGPYISGMTDHNIMLEDTAVAYNLQGAWFSLITPGYDNVSSSAEVNILIAAENVTHSGSQYAEIYGSNLLPLMDIGIAHSGGVDPMDRDHIVAFAVEGGSFTTEVGIDLPTKWHCKAVQQRTFTVEEENFAKFLFDGEPQSESIVDVDTSNANYTAYVGVYGNFQRFGFNVETTIDPTFINSTSNIAYGFCGFLDGQGPYALMWDSGSISINTDAAITSPFDPTLKGCFTEQGVGIRDSHVNAPTSTTKRIVNAHWDNDRDQWLFVTYDTTANGGVGVIAVNSAFSGATVGQTAFLDQTSDFTISGTPTGGYWIPRMMTNELDGIIGFGDVVVTADEPFKMTPTTISGDEVLQYFRILGSTGRTARVWVDYILYDSVDSVVSTKLQEIGLRVTPENVEWYKAKIIQQGRPPMTEEEIEEWATMQQVEYKTTLKEKERQGRLRRRRKQVATWREGLEDSIEGDFVDTQLHEFKDMEEFDKALLDYTPDPSLMAPSPTLPPEEIKKRKKVSEVPEFDMNQDFDDET